MIDWQRVALNLRTNYGPLTRVAKDVGAGDEHLQKLARGEVREPKFSIGLKLLDLHFDVMGDRHQEVII